MVVGNIQHLTLNIQHFPSNIQHLTLNIPQKESFCLPKGLLLPSKTSPFTNKKEPFCSAKGLLLKYGCYKYAVYWCVDVVFIPQHSWSWAIPD